MWSRGGGGIGLLSGRGGNDSIRTKVEGNDVTAYVDITHTQGARQLINILRLLEVSFLTIQETERKSIIYNDHNCYFIESRNKFTCIDSQYFSRLVNNSGYMFVSVSYTKIFIGYTYTHIYCLLTRTKIIKHIEQCS